MAVFEVEKKKKPKAKAKAKTARLISSRNISGEQGRVQAATAMASRFF